MEIIAKEVDNMAIEDDVLEKLEGHETKLKEHDIRLNSHDKQIVELQIKDAGYAERFNSIDLQFDSIKTTLVRFENNYLQSASSMTNLMTQVVLNTTNNNTEIIKSKNNNSTKINLKIIAIIGGTISLLLMGYFALKGVNLPKIM